MLGLGGFLGITSKEVHMLKNKLSYFHYGHSHSKFFKFLGFFLVLAALVIDQAYGAATKDIGMIATDITNSFSGIGQLIIAASYIAGFGLTLASIFKFKQHKDNPQQVPMGTPVALLVIGIVLVFLPALFGPAGQTIFGDDAIAGGFKGTSAIDIEKGKT
jgi:intracellular multiplication protein IcmD